MDSVKNDIGKLTMDDFLIMCSGKNDASRSDLRNAFHDVISFVKNVNQTNVILVSISYRHDLMNSHINTLRTGDIFLCPALLNVVDRWHIIMTLGHVMLKYTIPCSGTTQLQCRMVHIL